MSGAILEKYEAAGNDFLISVDETHEAVAPSLARALCDRHRGVGADGLVFVHSLDGENDAISMTLWNADGTAAETSGNGVRCAILFALARGLVTGPAVEVETVAGRAKGLVVARTRREADVRVEMGSAALAPIEETPLSGADAWRVDMGNPHLVLFGAIVAHDEAERLGRELEHAVPSGQNVEFASVRLEADAIDLLTFERGAGMTLSCGTGSCAAAAVARASGATGDRVVVFNPGGPLIVELSGSFERPEVALMGPARYVFSVDLDLDAWSRHGSDAAT